MSGSFGPGIIIVPNEVFEDGGATISASTGAFIAGNLTLATAEVGAVLSNGIIAIGEEPSSHITEVLIYSPALSLLGTAVPFVTSSWATRCSITSDYVATFYASCNDASFAALVKSFDQTGSVGATTWHVESGGTGPISIALSQDGTKFIYAKYASDAAPIKTWILGSDSAGSTIVAGVAGTSFGQDLLRLQGTNQFLIIASTSSNTVFTVRRYDETGTLLMSYLLTGVSHEASPQRLAVDLATPTKFWARTFNDISSNTTKFWQFDVASGSLLNSFTVNTSSDLGVSEVPFSCPFFAWSGDIENFVGTAENRPLVRTRQVGLPALTSNTRQFIGRAEVQMQPGLGVPANPTTNPVITMQWSVNNAATFGTAKQLNLGKTGSYYTRAYQHTVGAARQPVVKISCSDDVTFVPTDLFITRERGTN